ncbi:MAG: DUF721 domain-containing protein [Bacteroidaceae bacterium]|nr:DUF721 domain-containing protein [Bacteroidaceae bacterium]
MKKFQTKGISAILNQVIREEGLEIPMLEQRALRAWPEVMGEAIGRYTSDIKIHNGILYVKITSAPLRQNLQMTHKRIAEMINAHVGSHILSDVRFV